MSALLLLLLYLPAATAMDQWSTAMNCSSYPPDPDGFIEVDGPPGSASYCDESSYDNMMASVVTEKPNCDQQLVGTRRSSLSQDALSNQLSATVSRVSPRLLVYRSAPMLLTNGGV